MFLYALTIMAQPSFQENTQISTISRSASTLYSKAFLFALSISNAREPFQFVGPMERFQEDTIFFPLMLRAACLHTPTRMQFAVRFADLFSANKFPSQVVPLVGLGLLFSQQAP
jgi:hypothetical protein